MREKRCMEYRSEALVDEVHVNVDSEIAKPVRSPDSTHFAHSQATPPIVVQCVKHAEGFCETIKAVRRNRYIRLKSQI